LRRTATIEMSKFVVCEPEFEAMWPLFAPRSVIVSSENGDGGSEVLLGGGFGLLGVLVRRGTHAADGR
jgi:hypothetical protein